MSRSLVVLSACLAVAACDSAAELPARELGRALFSDPSLSPSEFNVFSCATCHTSTPEDDGAIASSLYGVVDRAAWWGGQETSLYEAVDFCYVYFMRGFPSLDPTSVDGRALYEHLASLGAGAPLPARPMTVVEQIDDPGRGDATRGAALYAGACAPCHGAPHTGLGRLGPNVVVIPEASLEFARDNDVDVRLVIAEKVRHGQFFGVGGNMPLYPLERLSDEDLADLLEHLAP